MARTINLDWINLKRRSRSWTPPASLPSRGLNACVTLKPLAAFFQRGRDPFEKRQTVLGRVVQRLFFDFGLAR
jgi:hypothetical protein